MNVLPRPLAVALFVPTLGLLPSFARAELWRPLGPAAGQAALDVALDPFDPAVFYAIAPGGLFRTDDRGAEWRLVGDGLGYDDRGEALAVSPSEPGQLLLRRDGAPLWRSADGGRHWSPIDPAGAAGLAARDVLFAPGQLSVAYAIVSASVYRSTDGGATWTRRGGGFDGYRPDALAADPEAPETLYAATSQITSSGIGGTRLDLRIFRSPDGGATWQALTAPGQLAPDEPGGLLASGIVVASGAPAAVYVAIGASGLLRSLDGGATWDLVSSGLEAGSDVERLTVDPSDPSVLYAVSSALVGPGVFKTTDRGDHWAPAAAGIPDGLPVHRVVVDAGDPSRLYGATDAGVFTSGDAGATWHSLASGMASEVERLKSDPHAPGTWHAITPSAALQRTTDGGATWSPFATSLEPRLRGNALDLAVAPCAAGTLYLSTLGTAPPAPPANLLLESTDGGATWSPADAGLEEPLPRLVVDPRLCDSLFGLGVGTTFWRTGDGAATWSGVPVGNLRSLLVDPEDASLLYAGTRSFDPGQDQGLCRSSDGGATWTCPATPFPRFSTTASLAAAPGSPPILYAAVTSSLRSAVFSSRDRGQTWRRAAGRGLPSAGLTDLVVDRDGSTLWAATAGAGVLRSRSGGDDWTPVSQGLESLRANQLALGPDGLYAATAAGIYLLDDSPGAGEPPPPDGLPWIADATYPGFRFKVRIAQGSAPPISGTREAACLPETVCLSGAVPGRSELFLRIVGPKPNGWLWPTLVKFSTSEIEVWIEQLETGRLRYYDLAGASPGVDALPGLFDRFGFLP